MTRQDVEPGVELVILADENGNPIGTEDKLTVHSTHTPLHFAFSAWVVRDGRLLLTRRALTKKTWPGVWTNSFCGHPEPGEENEDAVRRRAAFELGISSDDLEDPMEILPHFSYRAVDSSGLVENEICPVFTVHLKSGAQFHPNPEEVDSISWIDVDKIVAAVDLAPSVFSPWMVEELSHQQLRDAL